MSLTDYLEAFRALNVNRAAGHASPHKVCMLLAVMDLIEQGAITANQIPYEDALIEKFKQHMGMLGSNTDRANAYLPYYHLKSEGFWHHQIYTGKDAAYQALSESNSQSKMKEAIAYAYLDEELFQYLRYSVTREQLKSVLFENVDAHHREELRGALGGWSQLECELIARDYIDMLIQELNGHAYRKAEHRRNLQPHLDGRSEGSIEYKHQNISAILIDLGLPYIRGYKPAFNYQRLLAEVVAAHVDARQKTLLDGADRLIEEKEAEFIGYDWDSVIEEKPELELKESSHRVREYVPRHYNYAARESHNRRLGERGEEFVLNLEKQRLMKLGREDLVSAVEWTSKTRGDGAGYDIQSFDAETDQKIYIEVKTTNSGKYQPFMISDNEVAFSEEHPDNYSLYRVFQFKRDPRIFTSNGSIRQHVNLLAREYTASFK